MASKNAGRPLEFDRGVALRAASETFWRYGYAATTLDELTAAMGIGRSSFYGTFRSKHAVLMEVLQLYTDELFAHMEAAIKTASTPQLAVLSVLEIVACTLEPEHGCLFVNSVTELVPADAEVFALGGRHLGKVDHLIVGLLQEIGFSAVEARARSGAMLALATGAITLRKAGQPPRRIRAMLNLLPELMT